MPVRGVRGAIVAFEDKSDAIISATKELLNAILDARVLLHWNTNTPQSDVHHVYIKEAASLRPDLIKSKP
jgi:chorismate mutase